MRPQRYERVSADDHDNTSIPSPVSYEQRSVPSSPPPSFRSRASSMTSRHLLTADDPITTDAERTLHDAFDDGSPSDEESDHEGDDRQRLMRTATTQSTTSPRTAQDTGRPEMLRTFTHFPGATAPTATQTLTRPAPSNPSNSSHSRSNDGVFANLDAKPERGEKTEEQPPSYEAAAADAVPQYWETTILAPGNMTATDEVYVDGLPVGSLFSFVWNGMISMSFQFVGFLLTYLLHTTHAAKNGSRAGLGITLVQYGFYMRAGARKSTTPPPANANDPAFAPPANPNNHDFDPNAQADNAATAAAMASQASAAAASSSSSGGSTDWLAYALMIIGWFILIRAVSDFIRARKHEQLVLQSPERGLNVPIVAENERPETAV